MVYILGILIIVVLVAIIAVIVLKKKQEALESEPVAIPVARAATRNEVVEDFETDSENSELVHSTLTQIDRLVDNGQYDTASNELKKLFAANPKNSEILLKLLQVYSLTNNEAAFNQYYDKLRAFGDPDANREAEVLRSALSVAAPSIATSGIETPNFDTFNTSTTTESTQASLGKNGLDDSSFNELNDLNNFAQEPQGNNHFKSADDSDPDDFSAFNFDADEPTPSKTDNGLDLGNDFGDLAFDSKSNTNKLDDGLDFHSTPAPTPASKADDGLDFGLDADFGFASPAPAQTPAPTSKADDGLDFGLDDFNLNTNAAPAPTSTADANESFDFESFGLDTPAPTPVAAPAPTPDEVSFDDFAFDMGTPAPTPASSSNDSLSLGDLDIGTFDNFETTSPAPTKADDEFNFDNYDLNEPTKTKSKPQEETFDFDSFALDDLANGTTKDIASTEPTKAEEFDLSGAESSDFNFEFETPALASTVKAEEPDFGNFDIAGLTDGELNIDESNNQSATVTAASVDDGFDFDMGLPSEPVVETPTPASDTEFNFENFGLDSTPAPAATTSQDEVSFDDFALDIGTPAPVTAPAPDEVSFDDFALDITTPAPVVAEPVNTLADFSFESATPETSTPAPSKLDDDLFDASKEITSGLDDILVSPKAPVVDDFSVSAFDDSFIMPAPAPQPIISASLDTQSSIARQAAEPMFGDVILPSMQTISAGNAGLDFVNHLDNAQITLDLARNYLNLGEHSSAKRLLNEVLKTGTADQQHQAYTLLGHLA